MYVCVLEFLLFSYKCVFVQGTSGYVPRKFKQFGHWVQNCIADQNINKISKTERGVDDIYSPHFETSKII